MTVSDRRQLREWAEDGALQQILIVRLEALERRGWIDLSERFVDDDLRRSEKGGGGVGPTKRDKGSKIMAVADRSDPPLAARCASASPHEVRLIEPTIEAILTSSAQAA